MAGTLSFTLAPKPADCTERRRAMPTGICSPMGWRRPRRRGPLPFIRTTRGRSFVERKEEFTGAPMAVTIGSA